MGASPGLLPKHSPGLRRGAQGSLPFPWLHDGNDHPSGALGETNRLASSSTGIAEHLLCAHHHVQVGGEDRCPPPGDLLCNAWGTCPCPRPGRLSFPTLLTTICNPSLLSTTHHPAAAPSPAHLSIRCPVLVEEDETQPSFLRSLEACVSSSSHPHRESSSRHLPSFYFNKGDAEGCPVEPRFPDPRLLPPC